MLKCKLFSYIFEGPKTAEQWPTLVVILILLDNCVSFFPEFIVHNIFAMESVFLKFALICHFFPLNLAPRARRVKTSKRWRAGLKIINIYRITAKCVFPYFNKLYMTVPCKHTSTTLLQRYVWFMIYFHYSLQTSG